MTTLSIRNKYWSQSRSVRKVQSWRCRCCSLYVGHYCMKYIFCCFSAIFQRLVFLPLVEGNSVIASFRLIPNHVREDDFIKSDILELHLPKFQMRLQSIPRNQYEMYKLQLLSPVENENAGFWIDKISYLCLTTIGQYIWWTIGLLSNQSKMRS